MRFKSEKPEAEMANWPVQAHMVRTLPNGVRVGVFGVTVPMVTERMAARHVSAFLFDEPLGYGPRRRPHRCSPNVDLLIALTHIGIQSRRAAGRVVP